MVRTVWNLLMTS